MAGPGEGTETTAPQGPSLDDAASRIMSAGLLSGSSEDTRPRRAPPEPTPKGAPAATGTPSRVQAGAAAPEDPAHASDDADQQAPDGSEQADTENAENTPDPDDAPPPDGDSEDSPPPVRMLTVKVDGQELQVPEDEVLKGYSRTEDYTRKTQRLAEERKQWQETEVAATRQERRQYAELLGKLEQTITQLAPTEPDWDVLRNTVSPDVFAAEWTNWQTTAKRLKAVQDEQARVQALDAEDATKGFQSYVADQQARLADALPDMRDPEKAVVLKRDLTTFAKSRGFSEEDLAQVTDHRLVLLLHDAMTGATARASATAKAPEIKNKIAKALAPTAPGPSRSTAAKPNALAAAKARLRESGSVDDAGAAIAHLI